MRLLLKNFKSNDGAKLAFFFLTIGLTGFIFFVTPDLMPSSLLSILVYFIFSPVIDGFERRGVSRTNAVIGFFLLSGVALAAVVTWGIPMATEEFRSFNAGSGKTTSILYDRLHEQEKALAEKIPSLKSFSITQHFAEWISQSAKSLWTGLSRIFSQVLLVSFLVPFFSFVLLRDGHEIRRSLLRMVPNRFFETVYSLSYRIIDKMGGYVSARIIEAAAVTAMVTIGCLIFGVPYAILIGLFAGATNPIPYLGPVLGAIPALVLALLEPAVPNQLAIVGMILLIANLVDMFLIFPFLVARIVDLHPVVVVVCVIIGSKVFGVVGMIVAVPIASILKILIEEFYTKVYNQRADSPLR
ncbi:MAG TPA: AI-2E family transporter, partial [Oligoflexia bacterium]|nr:AI-2E family transporter [Oligoflexia bacterium]